MSVARHVTRCLAAGVVALLPLGGTVFAVFWLESVISGSWLAKRAFYFPGLGILLALIALYLVGFFVTSLIGRWLWRRTDRMLERLPLVGAMYQSLKEILGYDSGRERFFRGVVAVRGEDGVEMGLVTGETQGPDGRPCAIVFVPGSPNPTNGRLLLLDPATMQKLDVRVADALRALVSMGKAPLRGE
ncbi:MAG TPA: DUF502 domain-containing protein [Planctomycetota bacterium]|nr:DUF502 domain-containing protein [Planctomycetota bacterium]